MRGLKRAMQWEMASAWMMSVDKPGFRLQYHCHDLELVVRVVCTIVSLDTHLSALQILESACGHQLYRLRGFDLDETARDPLISPKKYLAGCTGILRYSLV